MTGPSDQSTFLSEVLHKLKTGTIETHPVFDARSAWLYGLFAIQIALTAALFALMGYSIHPSLAERLPFGAVFLVGAGLLLRRYGHDRLGTGLEITALTYLSGVASVLLLFPLTGLSWPFADWLLAGMDDALGLSWGAFTLLVIQDERVLSAAQFIYDSFTWQPTAVVIILMLSRLINRAWAFATAAAIGAALVMAIYPFVPAAGPAVHYGLSPEEFGALGPFPWQFGPELARLREEAGGAIRAESVFAMVSFPSYHALAAILFAWAVWPVKWARYPFLVLNLLMLAATVAIGIHYFSDVIGGAIAAVPVIVVAKKAVAISSDDGETLPGGPVVARKTA